MRKYNPSANIRPKPKEIPDGYCRRIVIIDAPNVLFASPSRLVNELSTEEKEFDVAGLLLMVYELLRQGFEVLVSAKEHLRHNKHHRNWWIFDELEKMEILTYVPVDESEKYLDKSRKSKDSLDDRILLHNATEYAAAVVSRDHFEEHKKWPHAAKRRISFNFERNPVKPLKELQKAENRFKFARLTFEVNGNPIQLNDALNVALCHQDDPDYEKVFKLHRQIHPNYFNNRLRKCEMMADFIQLKKCISRGIKPPHLDYYEAGLLESDGLSFSDFYEQYKWRFDEGKEHRYK